MLPLHRLTEKQMNWMLSRQVAEVKQVETYPCVKPSFNFSVELCIHTQRDVTKKVPTDTCTTTVNSNCSNPPMQIKSSPGMEGLCLLSSEMRKCIKTHHCLPTGSSYSCEIFPVKKNPECSPVLFLGAFPGHLSQHCAGRVSAEPLPKTVPFSHFPFPNPSVTTLGPQNCPGYHQATLWQTFSSMLTTRHLAPHRPFSPPNQHPPAALPQLKCQKEGQLNAAPAWYTSLPVHTMCFFIKTSQPLGRSAQNEYSLLMKTPIEAESTATLANGPFKNWRENGLGCVSL